MSGARDRPVERLAGEDCRWCDGASLAETEYKGDRALVCPDCGTPALRLFRTQNDRSSPSLGT